MPEFRILSAAPGTSNLQAEIVRNIPSGHYVLTFYRAIVMAISRVYSSQALQGASEWARNRPNYCKAH